VGTYIGSIVLLGLATSSSTSTSSQWTQYTPVAALHALKLESNGGSTS
jgi:hypothetical protein